MKLLLHICCANCGLFPIKDISSKGIDITGLWFNPNIHPEDEYRKRLDALRTLQSLWGLEVAYVDRYGLEEFERAVRAHPGLRCEACYAMRLGQAAEAARDMGMDAFSTTLLVSPYQRHDLIVDIGRKMERKYGMPFYAEDFRPGWKEGVRMSRELGLYRQNYCGCIYSKREREEEKARRHGMRDAERVGAHR